MPLPDFKASSGYDDMASGFTRNFTTFRWRNTAKSSIYCGCISLDRQYMLYPRRPALPHDEAHRLRKGWGRRGLSLGSLKTYAIYANLTPIERTEIKRNDEARTGRSTYHARQVLLFYFRDGVACLSGECARRGWWTNGCAGGIMGISD